MSALDVLRQVKQARRAQGGHKVVEWGNADFINEIGIENLTRRDLRNHLDARDLEVTGNRLELLERLRESLADEQLSKFAYKETNDAEALIQAELEERGAVYCVGSNHKGQLGSGDLQKRIHFTVVPQLRGLGVFVVTAAQDLVYCVTEQHDVYMWGGGGAAKIFGSEPKKEKAKSTLLNALRKAKGQNWLEPVLCVELGGEEVIAVAVGSSHYLAAGRGGDCLVWGDNDSGQLGLGDFDVHGSVVINNSFPGIQGVSAGSNHSLILTKSEEVYSWGHSANGRLGIGNAARVGVPESEAQRFSIPSHIDSLEPVRLLACGADHCLAYGASGVWAWGSGAGGKLGMGPDDFRDRHSPCLIPRLEGRCVVQISAAAWHSMAIVSYPPMLGGGWLYTWGSGYHGQLAHGPRTVVPIPELCEFFLSVHLLVKQISAGDKHCAAVTTEGELYTWGSNANGCLGRRIYERDVIFTPTPGHCGGFGSIVNRIGRGLVKQVSCGLEFTVVCTHPYVGPDLAVAGRLQEEANARQQEALLMKTGMGIGRK